jgi:formylglycine-generating enzyme required for sulfatase activity
MLRSLPERMGIGWLPAANDEVTWVPPALFEGYRLVRPIGAGGMGRVYLCHDLLLDRPVAIKFIARPDPDGHRRERFLLEGRTLARLVHPNVVLTFRVGDVEGRPFLVSEFVAGQSLDHLERPVHWRRALDIGIGLARGLAAAHRAGILHRDVKLQNVMLTPNGDVKLIDFGLATFVSEAAGAPARGALASAAGHPLDETESDADGGARPGAPLSDAGAVVGTRRYMAPERLAGQSATRQSDVFALGCVLGELCGYKVDAAPRPAELDPQLARIVDACREPDVALRYQSADEVLRRLEDLADDHASFGEAPPGNPYRGLESFDDAHRACFFGRAREVAAIVEKLRTEPVVVVAGDSGVGKSSICKAGVVPRVAESSLFASRAVRVVQLVPGRDPLARLAHALAEIVSDDAATVRARLLDEPTEVLRSIGRAVGEQTVVIFVDQIEELFTLVSPEEAAAFGQVLASLALSGSLLRVLACVRGDFLARLAALPGLGAEVARAPYLLRPLGADKLREVVVVPARRSGVSFESPATVDQLIKFAMSSEGALPLLQFTLAELWEARDRGKNIIGADTLARLGGVDGTFERHADRVLATFAAPELASARRWLSRLVTPEKTRASLTEDELRQRSPEERAVLEALVAGRLVVVRGDGEMTFYELAHEALITRWSKLGRWLDEDARLRSAVQRLGAAAKEWDRLGRRGDGLWTGRQLADAEAIERAELDARERQFLGASRARRRRGRLLAAALPVAALGVVLLAVLVGRHRARAELDLTVAQNLNGARALESGARQRDLRAQQLRVEAMRLFDEGAGVRAGAAKENSWRDAEAIWSRVVASEAEAEAGYGRATAAMESTLFVDPARTAVRAELTTLIDVRLGLAERMHHRELQTEMAERLRSLRAAGGVAVPDDDATLSVTSPAGVALTIAPYLANAAGRLTLGPARPWAGPESRLAPGSYLVVASSPECPPIRMPVLLGRRERHQLAVPPASECQAPPGFVLVPGGASLTGSDEESIRTALEDAPPHFVSLPSYSIGRFEVTIEEYVEWLEELPPVERAKRTPSSHTDPSSVVLSRLGDHRWAITLKPTIKEYTASWGQPIHYEARSAHAAQDWRRFPVTGVSFNDATAYAAWLDRTGRVAGAHVCRDLEWEKAARGADGRKFTIGRGLQSTDANFGEAHGGAIVGLGPDEVGSHPESASPYGVEDVHGNAYEIVASSRWGEQASVLGGSWDREAGALRLDNRYRQDPFSRNAQFGFRICSATSQR